MARAVVAGLLVALVVPLAGCRSALPATMADLDAVRSEAATAAKAQRDTFAKEYAATKDVAKAVGAAFGANVETTTASATAGAQDPGAFARGAAAIAGVTIPQAATGGTVLGLLVLVAQAWLARRRERKYDEAPLEASDGRKVPEATAVDLLLKVRDVVLPALAAKSPAT